VIRLYHVTKEYPGSPPALRDVTLHVPKGQFVFLTGPSGAGKSTLLRTIFCAEQPTAGQILVGGRNVARLNRARIAHLRRDVGVVFQDFKLIDSRTVGENVAFALEVVGTSRKEIARRTYFLLKSVGLEHKVNADPRTLSGGEKQRVAVCRALANHPKVLLADEPTGNLDADRSVEIMDLLHEANAKGTTVLVATHDMDLVERFRRRVIKLERGKIVEDKEAPPPEETAEGEEADEAVA
jgi:cell division transport system ATP-binding protein